MKAVLYHQYGDPEVLKTEEVDKPSPKENEVLIRVHAATANRTDCANLTAKPFIMRFFLGLFKPRKKILGTDFAGVIEEVGSKVTKFKVGHRVFGFDDSIVSSFAEYMTYPADDAIGLVPENIGFEVIISRVDGEAWGQFPNVYWIALD
ncbi:MAG: alcohol dehydrogenase catalytic domain-containing protein [Flavobacteriales bacterium]|nr:alcohol dehydrogenase catalytic domain-containing protein [Flavobacteriales bacterium]